MKNLQELLEILRRDDHDLDMAALPVFGGSEPDHTDRVWSWDERSLLVGTCAKDFEIVDRDGSTQKTTTKGAKMEKFTYNDKIVQHIEGRRWFSKTYGNTYFSLRFHYTDGSCELVEREAYGYAEFYLQHAFALSGIPSHSPSRDLREKFGVTYSVAEVLKRDL